MRIYSASKIWHAEGWQDIRAQGFDITSRWIDLGPEGVDPIVTFHKDRLWQMCLEDVTAADAVILYCGAQDEEQRGAVMEAGHAIGQGKPVYCINTCKTFSPCEISDVAFTYHALWNWVQADSWLTLQEGFDRAYTQALNNFVGSQFRAAAKLEG